MVKYYYAKRGSRVFNNIEFNVRRLLTKNIKLSNKQIRSYTTQNRYRMSIKNIGNIRKQIIVFKRKAKVKQFYLVHGFFEIVNIDEIDFSPGDTEEYRITPDKYMNIQETYLTLKKAKNRYKKLIKEFTLWINDYSDNPNVEINGKLGLSAINYGDKYGIRSLAQWSPNLE